MIDKQLLDGVKAEIKHRRTIFVPCLHTPPIKHKCSPCNSHDKKTTSLFCSKNVLRHDELFK